MRVVHVNKICQCECMGYEVLQSTVLRLLQGVVALYYQPPLTVGECINDGGTPLTEHPAAVAWAAQETLCYSINNMKWYWPTV